jgi:hypothetical protein
MNFKIKSIINIAYNRNLNYNKVNNRKFLALCSYNRKFFSSSEINGTENSKNKENKQREKDNMQIQDLEAIKENKTHLEKLEKQALSK